MNICANVRFIVNITINTFEDFVMTGQEVQDAIAKLGCSQKVFAQHCRVDERHLSKICRGRRPVPYWLDLVITEWLGPWPRNPPPKRFRIPQESAKPDDVHKTC